MGAVSCQQISIHPEELDLEGKKSTPGNSKLRNFRSKKILEKENRAILRQHGSDRDPSLCFGISKKPSTKY
jgi:hypothetical protein